MIEEELRTFLLASGGSPEIVNPFSTALEGRLYPDVLPQETLYPAATYTFISELEFETHDTETTNFTGKLIQFSVWSRTADTADEVRGYLKDRLRELTQSGLLRGNNPTDGRGEFEQETNLYRRDTDYRIWHA